MHAFCKLTKYSKSISDIVYSFLLEFLREVMLVCCASIYDDDTYDNHSDDKWRLQNAKVDTKHLNSGRTSNTFRKRLILQYYVQYDQFNG